jgi:hypothetical protein
MHAWDTLLFVLVSSCLFSVPNVFVLVFTLYVFCHFHCHSLLARSI